MSTPGRCSLIVGLHALVRRLEKHGEPVYAAIESMNAARFVHDELEMAGWRVDVADAVKVKGLAPLACKTDKIDAGCSPSSADVTSVQGD